MRKRKDTMIGVAVVTTVVMLVLAACGSPQPRGQAVREAEGGPSFTFAVIGDTRAGKRAYPGDPTSPSVYYLENIAWINRLGPDFTVNVGDLIRGYNTDKPGLAEKQWDEFDETVELYRHPLYMVVGNHDVWDEYSDAIYRSRYGPHYYSWDHQGCHFIALSSEIPGEVDRIGPAQLRWLERDLAASRDACRRFVFLHKPLWTGRYTPPGTNLWMEDVHPLLKNYNVDCVFAGHEHHYEPNEIDGVRCFITGGGGAEIGRSHWLGDFYHFLSVTVNDEGAPEIRIVRRNRDYPRDTVKQGLRSLAGCMRCKQAVVTGAKEASTLSLPLRSRMKRPVDVSVELSELDGARATGVTPARTTVSLKPGEEKVARFVIAPREQGLTLRWKIRQGDRALAYGDETVPVALSGEYSEWDAPPVELRVTSPEQVVIGRDEWEGEEDCSAVGWVTRTSNGLAITIRVRDDTLNIGDRRSWDNDSVEVYLDLRDDAKRGSAEYGKGIVHLIIVPDTPTGSVTFCTSEVPGIDVRTKKLADEGYSVRVFLPFNGLEACDCVIGEKFNFTFGVNDADTGARETQLMWSGTRDNWETPVAFGRLRPRKRGQGL